MDLEETQYKNDVVWSITKFNFDIAALRWVKKRGNFKINLVIEQTRSLLNCVCSNVVLLLIYVKIDTFFHRAQ